MPLDQSAAKAFHVSPFLRLGMDYRFRLEPPSKRVSLGIRASDAEGPLLLASLSGNRQVLSDAALIRLFLTHPLLTLKVTFAIHWHALRLMLKRIGIVRHPGPVAEAVTVGRQQCSEDARPSAERARATSAA